MKPMQHRNELADLARHLRCRTGAEIGVHLGAFSAVLLAGTYLETLYLIDPWGDWHGHKGDDVLAQCREGLAGFGPRAQFIREPSPGAVRHFGDLPCLDWVYIDGDHTREACAADLAAWWPLLRPGGIFAGHDYCRRHSHYGVIDAVDDFMAAHNLRFSIIDDGPWPTWWTTKP